jgi:hypothetical protein
MCSAGTVHHTYHDSDYQVPVDPMDDLQCESCQ